MNIEKILDTMRVALTGEEKKEMKFDQMKSADEQVVFEAEAFEVGQNVFVVTEEELIPAPEGEYPMDNQMVMVVDAAGVIAEMRDGGATEEEAEAETEPVEVEQEVEGLPAAKKIIERAEVETQFTKEQVDELTKKMNAEFAATLEKVNAENQAKLDELNAKVTELSAAEAPRTKPNQKAQESSKAKGFKYGQNKPMGTYDRVLANLQNLNRK